MGTGSVPLPLPVRASAIQNDRRQPDLPPAERAQAMRSQRNVSAGIFNYNIARICDEPKNIPYPTQKSRDIRTAHWLPKGYREEEWFPWHKAKFDTPIVFFPFNTGRGKSQSEQDHHLETVMCMMFGNGDALAPNPDCATFVLDIVLQQLNTLLKKVHNPPTYMRAQDYVITAKQVIELFRNNHVRLRRLIRQSMDTAANTRMWHRVVRKEYVPGSEGDAYIDEVERRGHDPKRAAALNEFRNWNDILFRAIAALDPALLELCHRGLVSVKTLDPRMCDMKRRIRKRNTLLPAEELDAYEVLARRSFVSRSGRINAFYAQTFHLALGLPPLEMEVIKILDFFAREIIAELVHEACAARQVEDPEWFSNCGGDDALQHRHYEEALRRLAGYRLHGDILFGMEDAAAAEKTWIDPANLPPPSLTPDPAVRARVNRLLHGELPAEEEVGPSSSPTAPLLPVWPREINMHAACSMAYADTHDADMMKPSTSTFAVHDSARLAEIHRQRSGIVEGLIRRGMRPVAQPSASVVERMRQMEKRKKKNYGISKSASKTPLSELTEADLRMGTLRLEKKPVDSTKKTMAHQFPPPE